MPVLVALEKTSVMLILVLVSLVVVLIPVHEGLILILVLVGPVLEKTPEFFSMVLPSPYHVTEAQQNQCQSSSTLVNITTIFCFFSLNWLNPSYSMWCQVSHRQPLGLTAERFLQARCHYCHQQCQWVATWQHCHSCYIICEWTQAGDKILLIPLLRPQNMHISLMELVLTAARTNSRLQLKHVSIKIRHSQIPQN